MEKGNKLYLHIEGIENGFIVKDLTSVKEENGKKRKSEKTYVANSSESLKKIVLGLLDEHLKFGITQEEFDAEVKIPFPSMKCGRF